jgi:hypothetical protein
MAEADHPHPTDCRCAKCASDRDPFGLGQMRDALLGAFNRTISIITPPAAEVEEDWTDPDYVLGAVMAQIEDLSPADKCRVLADALTQVIPELR